MGKGEKNDARLFSVGHEYIVIYALSLTTLRRQGVIWREPKPGAKEIWEEYIALRKTLGVDDTAIEKALRNWYKSLPAKHPSKALSRYKHIDKNGPWRDRDISWPGGNGPTYDVIHPVTKKPCKVPERGWGFATSEEMQRQINLGLIVFREDHNDPPFRKAHLKPIPDEIIENGIEIIDDDENNEIDQNEIGLQVMPSVIYKQSQVSVKLLRKIMGKKVFENPKDHEVLMRLFRYLTDPEDLILDSFGGSGTTAHAILQLNSEENSNRRFVMIEIDEGISKNITTERLKRVIKGYDWKAKNGSGKKEKGLGGGFRYCELGATLFDADGQIRAEVSYGDLAQHVYFVETGQPLPQNAKKHFPLLGVANEKAVYLLYNGILKDKSATGGNVLTHEVLHSLPKHMGAKVVYGNGCRLGANRLRALNITFKQIPYEIREA